MNVAFRSVIALLAATSLETACDAQTEVATPSRLVIATREVPPFAMKNEEDRWEGISVELLREVQRELEVTGGREITLEFRDLGLDEMLAAVERGEVDVAAAALTVNYDREKRMDFTHPFHSSGLGIAVGARQRLSAWNGILQSVFSRTLLRIVLGLFAALMVSAVAVYLFERRANREHFGGGALRGISSGLWWAAVTLTTVGYGDKVPKTVPGRIIGLLWMFVGLFIIAGFTASVTSALTVTQLKSRIAGPADLSRVKVATVAGSTSAKYLRSRHILARSYPDVQGALAELQQEKFDAVVYDAPILRYETMRRYPGEIFVLPITFEQQSYAFALPTDSPLRERINQVLLRKIDSPEWEQILIDYLGDGLIP